MRRVGFALRGQHQSLAIAREQLGFKILFQFGHMAAYGAVGHAQFMCGAREALVARGGFESAQGVQRWQTANHSIPLLWRIDKNDSPLATD